MRIAHILETRRSLHVACALAALLVLVAGGLAGLREYRWVNEREALRFEAAVDARLSALVTHLRMREAIAQAAAGAYLPSSDGLDGRLEVVDIRLLDYAGDVFSMIWAARVAPGQQAAALALVRDKGGSGAGFFGPGRRPLPPPALRRTLTSVVDILPRTPANLSSLGLDLASVPAAAAALQRAEATQRVAVTEPLNLVQLPGEKAVVLYTPIRPDGASGATIGYLGFSYRVRDLLRGLETGGTPPGPVRIWDEGVEGDQAVLFQTDGWQAGAAVSSRRIEFAGRSWRLAFARPEERRAASLWAGLTTGLLTAFLLALTMGAALFFALQSSRLRVALAAREAAEERLRVVAGELAHRVKNAFLIAQAVGSQTYRSVDADGERGRTFAGRMAALARSADVLMANKSEGTSLREIVQNSGLPFGARVLVEGEDVQIAADWAQSFHLLIHELWTNAAKHGALATPDGSVTIGWVRDGDEARFVWREHGVKGASELPARQGFGRRLVETMVPAQLGGQAELRMTADGLFYTLRFPLPPSRPETRDTK